RQGSRRDLQDKFVRDPTSAGADVYTPSVPTAISLLSSGLIAYVVTDMALVTNRFAGRIFVSLVDRRRQRTCPDAQVPVAADPLPHVTFRGDTLLVLAQDVGADGHGTPIVRKFLIDARDCAWIAYSN